jgi:hypothetical protein
MKNVVFFAIFILALCGCTNEAAQQSGNVTVMTPDFILPPMKNIVDTSGTIDLTTLDQARFRYDLIVESNSKRIYFGQLKKNETATISVPSGASLSFKVGVYYARNSESMSETYNAYLATGEVNNVILMPGESKYLTIKLDLKNPEKVTSYNNSNFGIATISGGVMGTDTNPYFSVFNLSSGTNEKYMRWYPQPTFTDVSGSTGIVLSGKGIAVKVPNSPTSSPGWWYIQSSGVSQSTTGYSGFSALPPSFAGYTNLLPRVFSVKTVYANDTSAAGRRYYYFLNYGTGYIIMDYFVLTTNWSIANVDFSDYNNLYEYDPFLFDVEQDALINATQFRKLSSNYTGYQQWLFFATKIGLFYVNELALKDFASGDRSAGINKFKKIIRIQNPYNQSEDVLITKVRVFGNTVYLGSKQGVYTIDKGGSEWNKFVYDSVDDFTYYDLQSVKKLDEFTYEEPIVSMDIANNILCIATPKRVWFKNLSNGKTDMVSVWDGLSFVPITKYANARSLNQVEFNVHDAAPINFTVWDPTNLKFWIGTDYGLCSVDLNRLNL